VYFIRVHLWLFCILRRDEAGSMVIISGFPDGDDLVDRDVAVLSVIIVQVQHARFYLQYGTPHARRAAAVNVDLLPDEP
jgi:hypothetical protein